MTTTMPSVTPTTTPNTFHQEEMAVPAPTMTASASASTSTAATAATASSSSTTTTKKTAAASKTAQASKKNHERKKQNILNKFLTKTYHLIDQCDPSIAGWSNDGKSFTVKDVARFEREVLPQYFNHGKFTSFTRQLNFYSFSKIRLDADLQRNNASIRFFHENFRQGHPELLKSINRTTAKVAIQTASSADQVEALQTELAQLQDQVTALASTMDERVEMIAAAIKNDYVLRIQKMEAAYADLYASLVLRRSPPSPVASSSVISYPTTNGSAAAGVVTPFKTNDIARYLRSASRS